MKNKRFKYYQTACFLVCLLIIGQVFIYGEPSKKPVKHRFPPLDEDVTLPQNLLGLLEKSKGAFTAEIREEFLKYSERLVHEDLKKRNFVISDEFWKWLDGRKELKEQLLSLYLPVDSKVFKNLEILKGEFKNELFEKYLNLMVAVAVGRRDIGLYVRAQEQNDRIGAYIYGSRYGQDMEASFLKSKEKHKAKRASRKSPEGVDELLEYLRPKFKTVKEFNDGINGIEELTVKVNTDLKTSFKPLLVGKILHKVFYKLHCSQEARHQYPTSIEFARFLITEHEKVLKNNGPVFYPIKKSPWPLLLGLGEITYPLNEAKDLWDKYQADPNSLGKMKGPYSWGTSLPVLKKAFYPRNLPSNSIQGQFVWGGICGTQSKIGRAVRVSLGKPIFSSGQSCGSVGHANWLEMNYDEESKMYYAAIGNSASSPFHTNGGHPLRDSIFKRSWIKAGTTEFTNVYKRGHEKWGMVVEATAEYHSGMGLAFNKKRTKFFDARIVRNIYKNLPQNFSKDYTYSLLKEGSDLNPYCPDFWYARFLAKGQTLSQARDLIVEMRKEIRKDYETPFGSAAIKKSAFAEIAGENHSFSQGFNDYINAVSYSIITGVNFATAAGMSKSRLAEYKEFVLSEKALFRSNNYEAILSNLQGLIVGFDKYKIDFEARLKSHLAKNKNGGLTKKVDTKKDARLATEMKAMESLITKERAKQWFKHLLTFYPSPQERYWLYNHKVGYKMLPTFSGVISGYRKTHDKKELPMVVKNASKDVDEYFRKVKPELLRQIAENKAIRAERDRKTQEKRRRGAEVKKRREEAKKAAELNKTKK